MMVFRQKGRSRFSVKVPVVRNGKTVWFNRPTGTMDPNTARKMGKMIAELGPADMGANDILEAVVARTIRVPDLWRLWDQKDKSPQQRIREIRAQLADTDLLTKRDGWIADVTSLSSADNARRYKHALDTLLAALESPNSLARSALTTESLKGWIAELPVKAGTKRRHHAAVSSFLSYCVAVGVLERNPLADIDAPAAAKPRDRHLSAAEAQALADAQESPFREFSALLAGTGIETGVAFRLTVADVDVARQEIRARGTKTGHRDRVAKVAAWAWPYVLRAIAGKLPSAKLFPFKREPARQSHRDACKALEIADYTNRDARHTYAVRMVKAGTPALQVSKQLGHADSTMVSKVYGLYEPTHEDRAHWEAIAAARDVAQEKKG